jgi:hypothetical protein
MSEPLTLEDIAALPVGARVWSRFQGSTYLSERAGPNLWRGLGVLDGCTFDDAEMAGGVPVYLDEPEPECAPGDSAGMWEPGLSGEVVAGAVDDIDGVCYACGEPATCHGRYEGHGPIQFACDECCGHGCEDGWCEPVDTDANAADSDGTPDTLPAAAACAS